MGNSTTNSGRTGEVVSGLIGAVKALATRCRCTAIQAEITIHRVDGQVFDELADLLDELGQVNLGIVQERKPGRKAVELDALEFRTKGIRLMATRKKRRESAW